MHKRLIVFELQSDFTTDYGVSCPRGSENIVSLGFLGILILIFLILADKQNRHNILCATFQVQSFLPLSIVKYGVSKQYAGSCVSDSRPLGCIKMK